MKNKPDRPFNSINELKDFISYNNLKNTRIIIEDEKWCILNISTFEDFTKLFYGVYTCYASSKYQWKNYHKNSYELVFLYFGDIKNEEDYRFSYISIPITISEKNEYTIGLIDLSYTHCWDIIMTNKYNGELKSFVGKYGINMIYTLEQWFKKMQYPNTLYTFLDNIKNVLNYNKRKLRKAKI